jgi:hypothetical protein
MLRVLLLIGLFTPLLAAEDRWVYLTSDGFQVFSEAGGRAGRTALVRLEQFRFALGKLVGKTDLKIDPPPQVYLFKTAREADVYGASEPIQTGKEHLSILLASDTLTENFERRYAKLLIESNTDRMPGDLERGLITLFSTLDVTGIRITVGKPPAAQERNLDWARIHMLTVDPEYYGKLPVLFYNLQKGADDDPAYQNAFGKSKAQVDAEAARYLAAGQFRTVLLPSRPMSAEHDFPDKPMEGDLMEGKLAGLRRDREEYQEYQALLAKARADKSETKALERAIELEPKQPEPHFLLAQREPDPRKRIELLKATIALDRRNASYWQALAESYSAMHNFTETAKAWRAAEQAAATPDERERMRRAWLDVERQRLDFEEAEKKRIAEENARELQKLKEAEIAKLRALEAGVNKGAAGAPGEKVEAWWTGPTPAGKAQGLLKQFDCIGKQGRLVIQTTDGKMMKLAVRDPSHIAITGEKEEAFSCGRQKPRRISVQYVPKADAKLATIGDVVTIEFYE